MFWGGFGTIFRLRSKKTAPAAAITTMGELPSLRHARKAPGWPGKVMYYEVNHKIELSASGKVNLTPIIAIWRKPPPLNIY